MKHLGDIKNISGYEAPIVDVITGGSPCQDLSVAGKRAGLAGERSGLFMEQMRIVKEMRDRDVRTGRAGFLVRPRYMVWENVPGAFSSGNPKGSDFQAVLEEIVRVVCKEAPPVPVPKEGWPKAGCISGVGDSGCTFSIAWRVHDAQFWGVPQRRKRIALVADFGGLSAPEILFERKGLSGDIEPCGEAGQEAARAAGNGVEGASCYGLDHVMLSGGTTYQGRGYYNNVSGCLKTQPHGVCDTITFQERGGKPGGGKGILIQHEHVDALSTLNNQSVYDARGNGGGEIVPTLTGDHQNRVTDYTDLCVGGEIVPSLVASAYKGPGNTQDGMAVVQSVGIDLYNQSTTGGVSKSLNSAATDSDHIPCVMKCFQNTGQGWWNESEVGATIRTPCGGDSTKANLVFDVDCRNAKENASINGTLQAKSNGGTSYNLQNVCRTEHVVRRLTPLECERLQGYPDGWTDIGEWTDSKGKKHKDTDSPRYKALGNSIALPFWQYLARRICAQYERNITMASLFDGIGGFPLAFERAGAAAVWASEIEEFPIAVTKLHFPEREETT